MASTMPALSASRGSVCSFSVAALLLGGLAVVSEGQAPSPPYKVTITDDKQEIAENHGAIDPTQRVRFQHGTAMNVFVTDDQAGTLQRVHFPMFHVDGNPMRVL